MLGLAVGIEGVYLQPAEVHAVTGGPYDAADAGLGQVQLLQRVAHALRVGQSLARFGLFRQVQAVAFDVGIGRIQQGQVVVVAAIDVLDQVVLEARDAVFERLGQADQGHALVGEGTEVHGVATTGATDRDGHMLATGLGNFRVPLAQHAQPPAEVAVAVGTRRAVVGADRQVHLASGAHQLFGNLHAGRAGTDHQYRAFRQLLWVEVSGGMNLVQVAVFRRDGRDHRFLERAGGGDYAIGANHAFTGVDGEARAVAVTHHALHFNAGAHGQVVLAYVLLE